MPARSSRGESLSARFNSFTLPRLSADSKFFSAATFAYAFAIISATLALNPYFAQTWDVNTFIQAARELWDGNPLDLYARSRAAQTWPYAYPPLHALVVAFALGIGDAVRALIGAPDFVWARVPPLLADIGIAFLLSAIVRRKTSNAMLARAAFLLWLFNPVTFYNTAAQAHFESEWLFFILLAYAWMESGRGIALPALALAVAVLFKQIAMVYALPVWIGMSLRGAAQSDATKPRTRPNFGLWIPDFERLLLGTKLSGAFSSLLVFTLITGAVSLPFMTYSDDYVFMNTTYVENVPVQTHSWLVAVLGLTRAAPNALTSDFFLIRSSTLITLIAVAIISIIAARRGWSLYFTGALITLAFFLLSRKVMGYYYVMLFPFLLAEFLPRRRWDLILAALVAASFISLSPYYAGWTNHAHWWVYAILGAASSVVWVALAGMSLRGAPFAPKQPPNSNLEIASHTPQRLAMTRTALVVTLGMFAAAFFAALLQPFFNSTASPLRAPIIAAGLENFAWIALAALLALTLGASALTARFTRGLGEMPRAAYGIPVLFAPLAFAVYTLTKETTAIFEMVLKALGV